MTRTLRLASVSQTAGLRFELVFVMKFFKIARKKKLNKVFAAFHITVPNAKIS